MVCNNFPVHLHYHMENVYIAGIVPGPNEPSEDHFNHILCPLIEDLLCAWSPGLQLAQTAIHDFGCLVHCAVILLICDLLATQKTAGFSGLGLHEGKFCLFCLQDHSDISNTDTSSWHLAEKCKNAPSEGVRTRIYKSSGIRWSELLRLPYWNPTCFTVVDSMHNLFI
ncbi:hypothetical protein BDN67DRAFT_992043 [Paxillus ammoniavirescens]|nr:hypothetical protein BDN67DRAFT_992043 [Paxillus ammoniavirescens]